MTFLEVKIQKSIFNGPFSQTNFRYLRYFSKNVSFNHFDHKIFINEKSIFFEKYYGIKFGPYCYLENLFFLTKVKPYGEHISKSRRSTTSLLVSKKSQKFDFSNIWTGLKMAEKSVKQFLRRKFSVLCYIIFWRLDNLIHRYKKVPSGELWAWFQREIIKKLWPKDIFCSSQ